MNSTDRDAPYSLSFYEDRDGSRVSAWHTVPILLNLFEPDTVIDVGCGDGAWLAVFKSKGVDVIGVDGPWVSQDDLLIPKSDFIATDLARSALRERIEGLDRTFSLCLSLEVAEHLPSDCSDGFVSLLTKLSDIVLFSAAIPGQGGTNHINEQWCSYWITKFEEHRYVVSDVVRAVLWGNTSIEPWYRQNMLLFMENDTWAVYDDEIRKLVGFCGDEILSKVHPDFYWMATQYYRSEQYLRSLKPSILLSALIHQTLGQSRDRMKKFLQVALRRLHTLVHVHS
jgi:hypothetical protein